jgi:hypothetical protein
LRQANAAEQVERMSAEQHGQEDRPSDQPPERAIYREEHWSYLLRLWRGGEAGWRASLQSIPAGERHMFADLESLLEFLLALSR